MTKAKSKFTAKMNTGELVCFLIKHPTGVGSNNGSV